MKGDFPVKEWSWSDAIKHGKYEVLNKARRTLERQFPLLAYCEGGWVATEFIKEVLRGDKFSKSTERHGENGGHPLSGRSEQSAIEAQGSQAGPSTEVTLSAPSTTARVRFAEGANSRRDRMGGSRLGGSRGYRRGCGAARGRRGGASNTVSGTSRR